MFYKQFLKITAKIGLDFIEEFDYWLATIPDSKQGNISSSLISAKFNVPYSLADFILNFAENEGVLEKYFLVCCPNDECGLYLKKVEIDELANVLMEPVYCHNCDNEHMITPKDIFVVFRRKIKPDVSEEEINLEIKKRLNISDNINFNNADSLDKNKNDLYRAFYNPDQSAYEYFQQLREALDFNYGKNTTDKGASYETLALELFTNVKLIKGTNKIKTYTNQFDCSLLVHYDSMFPSIFNKMSPYFIVECKNEDITPSNTYFHKLSDIMSMNDAKLGIVFSRKPASREDIQISYNQYLLNKNTNRPRYMISISDDDLNAIIDDEVNLLDYLDYKVFELTTNARNSTYDMFKKKS